MENFENVASEKSAELNKIADNVETAGLDLKIASSTINETIENQKYSISSALGNLEEAINSANREIDPRLISSMRSLLDELYGVRSKLDDAIIQGEAIKKASVSAENAAAFLRESANKLNS